MCMWGGVYGCLGLRYKINSLKQFSTFTYICKGMYIYLYHAICLYVGILSLSYNWICVPFIQNLPIFPSFHNFSGYYSFLYLYNLVFFRYIFKWHHVSLYFDSRIFQLVLFSPDSFIPVLMVEFPSFMGLNKIQLHIVFNSFISKCYVILIPWLL